MRIVLSDHERQQLEELVVRPTQVTVLHRAQALLWLYAGESVLEVAQRLRVSRCTIYNWVQGFQDMHTADIRQRLTASPPHDQAQAVRARLEPLLRAVIDHDPHEFGYHAPVWTATLLSQYLWKEHGITASRQRINDLMRRLDQPGQSAGTTLQGNGPVRGVVSLCRRCRR